MNTPLNPQANTHDITITSNGGYWKAESMLSLHDEEDRYLLLTTSHLQGSLIKSFALVFHKNEKGEHQHRPYDDFFEAVLTRKRRHITDAMVKDQQTEVFGMLPELRVKVRDFYKRKNLRITAA